MTLISAANREAVVARGGGRCEYCRLGQDTQVATFPVDHIIPVSEGGETALHNLCLTCPRCNASKWTHVAGIDPTTGETVSLYNPRTQRWAEHFRWSDTDPAVLESATAIGRATIAVLDLNHSRHLEVRRWLMTLDLHPPAEGVPDDSGSH